MQDEYTWNMKKLTFLQKFGLRIRDLRKLRNMSQEQLAEKAGLSPTYVGNLERGEQNPTLTSAKSIAEAIGISLSELLTLSDDKRIQSARVESLNKAAELLEMTLDLVERHRKR